MGLPISSVKEILGLTFLADQSSLHIGEAEHGRVDLARAYGFGKLFQSQHYGHRSDLIGQRFQPALQPAFDKGLAIAYLHFDDAFAVFHGEPLVGREGESLVTTKYILRGNFKPEFGDFSMDKQFLEGKVAVITGASRGLGRAIALALGEAGAKLALVSRNQEKLAETRKLACERGAEAEVFVTDVRYEAQVRKLEHDVIARFGAAHIVVNNAGTTVLKTLADLSLDEWRLVIDTNLTGAFLVSRAFVPHLRAQKWGRIINITSTMAHVGSVGRSAYCASKSGLLAVTKCLALELVSDGITVVAISPGFYETDLTAPLRANPQENAALMAATPMGRWGRPQEIGDLARYLCGDGASFVTGTDILIDGGWVAR